MSPAGPGQRAVQHHAEGVGAGIFLLDKGRRPGGTHGVGAGGAAADAVDLSYAFHSAHLSAGQSRPPMTIYLYYNAKALLIKDILLTKGRQKHKLNVLKAVVKHTL
jgi:hypothetical protein